MSKSRVYTDVNVLRPKDYWDYESLTVQWGEYPKPVLTKGWRAFVRSKQLRVDDKVAFYMEKEDQSDSVKYRVEVEKAVKIFGTVFGHEQIHC
ncbi:hypothetical protein V6N13_105761 [Hibiscus sabdariffa]